MNEEELELKINKILREEGLAMVKADAEDPVVENLLKLFKDEKKSLIREIDEGIEKILNKYENPILEPHPVDKRKFCSACGEVTWNLKEHLEECKPDIRQLEEEVKALLNKYKQYGE